MFGKMLISRELGNGEFVRAYIPNVTRINIDVNACIYISDEAHLVLLKNAPKPYIAKFSSKSWDIRLRK